MEDYEAIKKQIRELFDTTGITVKMSNATLTDDKQYKIEITFKHHQNSLTAPYSMGLGLFRDNGVASLVSVKIPEHHYEERRVHGEYKPNLDTKTTHHYFKPELIFANICVEAALAMDMSVEEWCNNEDSHKGHIAHATCINYYQVLLNMVGREKIEQFAELYNQL